VTRIHVTDENAYKFDLPYAIRNHNVFHATLLDRYSPPTASQPPSKLQPMVVNDSDGWQVDRILDTNQRYRKFHYLVLWVGFGSVRISRDHAENLGNAQELVDDFHPEHLRKPP
jgi:hypothetical protein